MHTVFQLYNEDKNKTYQQFLHDATALFISVATDIPPVLDHNDTIERLSGKHFPSSIQQKGTSPHLHTKCHVFHALGLTKPKVSL